MMLETEHTSGQSKIQAFRIVLIFVTLEIAWTSIPGQIAVSFGSVIEMSTVLTVLSGSFHILVMSVILYRFIYKCHNDIATSRRELAVSEERQRLALNATSDGLWDWDLMGGEAYLSPNYYEMTGFMEGEVIPDLDFFKSMIHPDDLPEVLHRMEEHLQGDSRQSVFDFRLITKSGDLKWVLGSGRVVERDVFGAPLRMVGTVTDLSDHKIVELLRKYETNYSSLFNNMNEGFAFCKMHFADGQPLDFEYVDVNPALERLTGLQGVVGKRVTEIMPSIRESNPEIFEIYGRVTSTRQPERFETYLEPLDTWFHVSAYSPAEGYFVAVFHNITERKRSEEEREATLELLRLCNSADDWRGLMRDLMNFFQGHTGCEAIGVRIREGEDFPYFETKGFSEEFVQSERSLCAYDPKGEVVRDGAGHPAFDCMCGNILCGRFSPEKPFFSHRGSFWSNCTSDLLSNTTETDRLAKTRNRCNGEGYESVALIPIQTHGEVHGLFQFNDRRKGRFTDDKIAQLEDLVSYVALALVKLRNDEVIRESSMFNQQIIASAGEGVVVLGSDLRYQVWNGFMEQLSGLPACDVIGRHPLDLFPSMRETGALARLESALCGYAKPPADLPYEFPCSGRSGWFLDTDSPLRNTKGEIIGVICTQLDITERKELEKKLVHSQKMEGIGTMAGGIAHDFNNILTVINGYGTLMEQQIAHDDPLRKELEQIMVAADRAAVLVSRLLAFSRKLDISPEFVNMADIVRNIGKFLVRIIGEDIKFDLSIHEERLLVFADSNQIEQIMMNLAANARDAMPQGGTLCVELGSTTLDQAFIRAYSYGKQGRYALLSVTDTGQGMNHETQQRIFEPFFTTKEVGKGTGLGLSTVYGIVKQHQGYINVVSTPGNGTTFKIYLPLVESGIAIEKESMHQDLVGGTETILLAEDDPDTRTIIRQMLRQLGYSVIEAMDGEEAVQKFLFHQKEIHLLLFDIVMPKKNGMAAYEEIVKLSSTLKVIFLSGYTADILQHRTQLDHEWKVVRKPVQLREIAVSIRTTLDGNVGTDPQTGQRMFEEGGVR
jgi:PAS domain S-box-containing protein